ncbi:MAG: lysine biosynthesis protein LysW [Candidatus Latescibacterota bacterium]
MAKSKEKEAYCPNCDAGVSLKEPIRVGIHVVCTTCGEKLEVVSMAPELDYADEGWEEEFADKESDEDYEEE